MPYRSFRSYRARRGSARSFNGGRRKAFRRGSARAPVAFRGFFGPQRRRYFPPNGRRLVAERFLRSPQELKVIDSTEGVVAADTTGSITGINFVATGTDFTNRIGRKVIWKSFTLTALIQPSDAATDSNLWRIMVVYDKQPNGALPAVTDVLTAATSTSNMNLNNRDRFRVLLDKMGTIGFYNVSQQIADKTSAMVRKYKRINLQTIFDGTAADIGSIQTGSIFVLTVGTNAAGLGSQCWIATRMRFVDA